MHDIEGVTQHFLVKHVSADDIHDDIHHLTRAVLQPLCFDRCHYSVTLEANTSSIKVFITGMDIPQAHVELSQMEQALLSTEMNSTIYPQRVTLECREGLVPSTFNEGCGKFFFTMLQVYFNRSSHNFNQNHSVKMWR